VAAGSDTEQLLSFSVKACGVLVLRGDGMALLAHDFDRRIRNLQALAREVRTKGEAMHDAGARRTMFLTADAYKRMAKHLERAEEHLSLPDIPSPPLPP
jgi:hypothetical protein